MRGALASVSFGFVLVRVRVNIAIKLYVSAHCPVETPAKTTAKGRSLNSVGGAEFLVIAPAETSRSG